MHGGNGDSDKREWKIKERLGGIKIREGEMGWIKESVSGEAKYGIFYELIQNTKLDKDQNGFITRLVLALLELDYSHNLPNWQKNEPFLFFFNRIWYFGLNIAARNQILYYHSSNYLFFISSFSGIYSLMRMFIANLRVWFYLWRNF